MSKMSKAIPENFDRFKKGDALIRQELQRLLEVDAEFYPNRPLLTEDGYVRLPSEKTGKIEKIEKTADATGKSGKQGQKCQTDEQKLGPHWQDILSKAPSYFSNRFAKIRKKADYGTAVYNVFVRIGRQLNQSPHVRKDSLHFFLIFLIYIF